MSTDFVIERSFPRTRESRGLGFSFWCAAGAVVRSSVIGVGAGSSARRPTFFLVARQERRQRSVPRRPGPAGCPRVRRLAGPVAKLACGSDNATGQLPASHLPLGGTEGEGRLRSLERAIATLCFQNHRHSRECGNPSLSEVTRSPWIPASAGMTAVVRKEAVDRTFGDYNAPPIPSVEPAMRRGKWGSPGPLSEPQASLRPRPFSGVQRREACRAETVGGASLPTFLHKQESRSAAGPNSRRRGETERNFTPAPAAHQNPTPLDSRLRGSDGARVVPSLEGQS